MVARYGVLSRSPQLGVLIQHAHGSPGPPDPPDDPAFARRALAQARFWFRPVLPLADGTLGAGDRMMLARRGYGRES